MCILSWDIHTYSGENNTCVRVHVCVRVRCGGVLIIWCLCNTQTTFSYRTYLPSVECRKLLQAWVYENSLALSLLRASMTRASLGWWLQGGGAGWQYTHTAWVSVAGGLSSYLSSHPPRNPWVLVPLKTRPLEDNGRPLYWIGSLKCVVKYSCMASLVWHADWACV